MELHAAGALEQLRPTGHGPPGALALERVRAALESFCNAEHLGGNHVPGTASALPAVRQLRQALLAARQQLRSGELVKGEFGLWQRVRLVRHTSAGAQQSAIFAYPAGQQSLRVVLDPLVEERGDLPAQVRGMIEAR